MNEKDMLTHLSSALEKTAPNDANDMLSRCETQAETPLPTKKRRATAPYRAMLAACLALAILCSGLVYRRANAVASVVSLDVNPSFELSVSRGERVLSCRALNDEAQAVLADMDGGDDLVGAKLRVAVNAIVGSLLRCGYLESISSAIMISVEDSDTARAEKLQRELMSTVDEALSSVSQAAVLSQTLTQDASLTQKAHERNISTGKAALVERVRACNASLSFDALAALSVAELKGLLECGAPGMPIGSAEAAATAEEYAGTLALDSVTSEVDVEFDELPPHYEVELHTLWGEYEYKIDAFSGAVLSGAANIIPTAQTTPRDEITLDEAKAAALKHAGLRTATFLEAEREDDKAEYDIEFTDGTWEYDYTVSALTGEILDFERERLEGDDKGEKPDEKLDGKNDGTVIGAAAAKAAALRHAGLSETQVRKLEVEAEYEDGRLVYEVEFEHGNLEYEYTIDAHSGAVLEHECEYDD